MISNTLKRSFAEMLKKGLTKDERYFFQRKQVRVALVQGDMTKEQTDAIVNAANEDLHHMAGLAGMIVKNGGKIIQEESFEVVKKNGGEIPTGTCAVTGAGKLASKYVIHAVGPIYSLRKRETCRELLRSAVRCVFEKANELKLSSYSITAISSGIFGYPKDLCAEDMLKELTEQIEKTESPTVDYIRFVIFDTETFDHFKDEFIRYEATEVPDEEDEEDSEESDKKPQYKTPKQKQPEEQKKDMASTTAGKDKKHEMKEK